MTCKIYANKVLKCGTHQYFLVLLPYGTRGKNFFSPVGVRADLHDAPGAALLTFFQLVVYDQLSRLQHRHKTMGYCKFLMTSPPQKRPSTKDFLASCVQQVFFILNSLRFHVFSQDLS